MGSFHDLYQDYLNCSDSERVSRARNALSDLYRELDKMGVTSENQAKTVLLLVKAFVSADKFTSRKEHELWNSITGLSWSYDDFFEMTNGGSAPDFQNSVNGLIDSMSHDAKMDAYILCLCFMAVDGTITVAEQNLFEKFLG